MDLKQEEMTTKGCDDYGLFRQDGDNLGGNAAPFHYTEPIRPQQSHSLGQGSRLGGVSESSTGRCPTRSTYVDDVEDKSQFNKIQTY